MSPLDNSTPIGPRHADQSQSRPGTDHVLLVLGSARPWRTWRAGVYGGKLVASDADAVLEWPSNPSPDVQVHITSVDVSGTAAYAKLEIIDWIGMRFTDYLLLAQVDGECKISAKLADSHSGAAESQ